MPQPDNTRIVLASRPEGRPTPQNFRLEHAAIPAISEGQVLLKILYLSLDPYMRGRMSAAKSYADPVEIGQVMEGGTVATVLQSRHPDFAPGEVVLSYSGWQSHAVAKPEELRKLDPKAAPVTTALGVLGMPGFTAYAGLLTIGQPKPGETLVVAAASGPVGSAVGQIAKLKGARAVGIAGGAEKCAFLRDVLGFDAAIDYRGKDVRALTDAIRAEAPDGIDVIFENVGGDILDAGLMNLRHGARIGLCGLISEYNSPDKVGARNIWQLIVHRAAMRGLLVADYIDRFAEGGAEMAAWLQQGRLVADEHVDEGIENSFDAFMRLFAGSNQGKMILKIA